MNEKSKLKELPDLNPTTVDDVKKVDLVIRNIDGEGVLFTRDEGKMIGQQLAHLGHYYYMGHGKDRKKFYRATFLVDNMPSDKP